MSREPKGRAEDKRIVSPGQVRGDEDGQNQSQDVLLRVNCVSAGYGRVAVLADIDLEVRAGTIVVLVGSNGAGKTTLLRCISGLIKPSKGQIVFDGKPITGLRPDRIVAAGLLHVAEGRRLFGSQSVADNLKLGLYGSGVSRIEERLRLESIYELFPMLGERHSRLAGVLSGGQQQMLAIGQALIRKPKLLMLDEPSLGLAPVIIDAVFDILVRLRRLETTILLVEQVVDRAMKIADHAYVIQTGRMLGDGEPKVVESEGLLELAYLGAGAQLGAHQ